MDACHFLFIFLLLVTHLGLLIHSIRSLLRSFASFFFSSSISVRETDFHDYKFAVNPFFTEIIMTEMKSNSHYLFCRTETYSTLSMTRTIKINILIKIELFEIHTVSIMVPSFFLYVYPHWCDVIHLGTSI